MADLTGLDPERTIRLLRTGSTSWQRHYPPGHSSRPVSFRSGRPIRGGENVLELIQRAEQHGYQDNRWGTASAIRAAGGTIGSGELGHRIVLQPERPSDSLHSGPRSRVFTYYNAEQTKGLNLSPRPLPLPPWYSERAVEALFDATGVRLAHSATAHAVHYDRSRDLITAPPAERFVSPPAYQHALLHHLGHATGSRSRLHRPTAREAAAPNASRAAIAREALRADMQAVFTGQHLGTGSTPQSPVAYADDWTHLIQRDPSELWRAAHDADNAAAYLLDTAKERLAALEDALYSRPTPPPDSRPLTRTPGRPPPDRGPSRGPTR